MKYSTIIKETNPNTGTLTLSDLSSKLSEKSKNIRPLNVPRDGMCKDRFQSFKILSIHIFLVPQYGTTVKVEFSGKVQSERNTGQKPPVTFRPVCAWYGA